jgi:ABC-type nitrate/sulfonate/bicarbonate transport system permease component
MSKWRTSSGASASLTAAADLHRAEVALPIALIVEIVSEKAMGGEGIGGTIITQMRFGDSPGVFSGIVAIAIVGSGLVKAMELIRRRLLVWHPETTG